MKKGLKVAYIPYFHDDMNDVAFSKKYNYRWSNYLKKMIEEDGGEIHTFDILPFEEADAILSFDNVYFQNNRFFRDLYNCDKLGCTTHIDYEPPSANCRIHSDDGLKKLSNLFKSLVTYNDNVVNGDTIVKGNIGDFFSQEQKYEHDFKDRKLLTIIANYRVDLLLFERHPYELYTERKNAVAYFQEKCPNDFDLYGDYWTKDYKKCWVKKLSRSEKFDYLRKYKFIISYDSIRNQNGYISEKIFDCFNAKIVPIYWGANNVTDYIPKECFIDKRDFETYDELYEYLTNMTEEEYEKYIEAIEKYLKSDQYLNLFSSKASAERLYNELKREKREINKEVAKQIIDEFDYKRHTDFRYNCTNNCYDYHYPKAATINGYLIKREDYDHYNHIFNLALYTSKDYKIDIYNKNVNDVYYKLETRRSTYKTVHNGVKIECKMDLLNIRENIKIALYAYNRDTEEYTPLYIEKLFNLDKYCKKHVMIKDNEFIYKLSLDEKIEIFLGKRHLGRLWKITHRLIKFPWVVIKEFIHIFQR